MNSEINFFERLLWTMGGAIGIEFGVFVWLDILNPLSKLLTVLK